ncbi:MAG: site-specific integrase [Clostridia bacterium]|nr:site-specific integrase [Clostridia bacterium]
MYFNDWLDNWLDKFIKPTCKASTYELYKRLAASKIAPRLGGKELGDLSASVLQEFTATLAECYSPNTVQNVLSIVKSSLRCAEAEGIADSRPASRIRLPRAAEKKINCLSGEEQARLEMFASSKRDIKHFGITLSLYTGLRIGELLALKWTDIDFNRGYISVNRTCRDSWEGGKYVKLFDTPKTPSSVRLIPVPKQMLPELRRYRRHGKSAFVICGDGGEDISVRSYQRTFELLLKRAGIKQRGFHSLRHTFATRAAEMGMDVKTLSEIMGHTNPTLTLRRYTHSLASHKAEMMDKLGKALYRMDCDILQAGCK